MKTEVLAPEERARRPIPGRPHSPPLPALETVPEVPGYQALAVLAQGTQSLIVRGRDQRLGREVALKFLRNELLREETSRERFYREARITARLSHPNIVQVLAVEEEHGVIVYELLDGETLWHKVEREGPLSPEDAFPLAYQAALGLAEAHRIEAVHRDVKPKNLFLTTEGVVKVLDFGVAFSEQLAGMRTRVGTVLGTPAYMPPEQGQGQPARPASDVYGLGATLYFLLSGRPPYEGSQPFQVLKALMASPPDPLGSLVPALSPRALAVVERAMARDPGDRYPSMSAMSVALREACGGRALELEEDDVPASGQGEAPSRRRRRKTPRALQAGPSAPVPPQPAPDEPLHTRRVLALLGACVVTAVLGAGAFFAWSRRDSASSVEHTGRATSAPIVSAATPTSATAAGGTERSLRIAGITAGTDRARIVFGSPPPEGTEITYGVEDSPVRITRAVPTGQRELVLRNLSSTSRYAGKAVHGEQIREFSFRTLQTDSHSLVTYLSREERAESLRLAIRDERVAVTWRMEREGGQHLYLRESPDGGQTWGAIEELGGAAGRGRHHSSLAWPGEGLLAAWPAEHQGRSQAVLRFRPSPAEGWSPPSFWPSPTGSLAVLPLSGGAFGLLFRQTEAGLGWLDWRPGDEPSASDVRPAFESNGAGPLALVRLGGRIVALAVSSPGKGQPDVLVRSVREGRDGESWSPPRQVSEPGIDVDEIAAVASEGRLLVAYDEEDEEEYLPTALHLMSSTDGGATFQRVAVPLADESLHWGPALTVSAGRWYLACFRQKSTTLMLESTELLVMRSAGLTRWETLHSLPFRWPGKAFDGLSIAILDDQLLCLLNAGARRVAFARLPLESAPVGERTAADEGGREG